MMARKLSHAAQRRRAVCLVGMAAGWLLPVGLLVAEPAVRDTSQPAVIPNPFAPKDALSEADGTESPFADDAPAARWASGEPDPAGLKFNRPKRLAGDAKTRPGDGARPSGDRRQRSSEPVQAIVPGGPRMYRNPFAESAVPPSPISVPLAPGPISRWRPSLPVPPDQSPVKRAILSAEAAPTGDEARPAEDPIQQARLPWDRLPPAEQLRLLNADRANGNRSTNRSTGEPAESIRSATTPLAQPAWLVPDDSAEPKPLPAPAELRTPFDPFETAEAIAAEHIEPPEDPESLGDTGDASDQPPEPDMAAVIVADYFDSPEGWHARAVAAAHTAETLDELTAVLDDCQRGLEIAPPAMQLSLRRLAAWACNRRGELEIDAGNEAQALRDFEAAIDFDPECWLAIHNRGVTLAQRDALTDALQDFDRVIELNPGLAVAYRNRGEVLASLGRLEAAIRDYDHAMEQMADDAMLYLARGYAYQQLGDYDSALDDLNRSLELDGQNGAARTQRGNLYAERGEFDRALADLQRAVEIDPNVAEGYRSLAWLLATCPDPKYRDAEHALTAAREAVARWPHDDPYMLDTLAAAHANAGQFAEACRVQQQAIDATSPESAGPLERRLALYRQRLAFRTGSPSEVRAAAHEAAVPEMHPTAHDRR